jgi:hypothetical protein
MERGSALARLRVRAPDVLDDREALRWENGGSPSACRSSCMTRRRTSCGATPSARKSSRSGGRCAMIAACVSPAQSFPSPCSPASSSSSRRARLQRRARSFPTPRSFGRSSGRPMRGSRIDRSAGRARTRSTLGAAGPGRMRWPRSRTATSASRTSPSGSRAAGRASGRTEATRAGTSASRRRRRCCASGGWPAAAEARSRGGRTPCTVRRNLVPNFVPNSAQLTPSGRTSSRRKAPRCSQNHPIWQPIVRLTQVRILAAP